MRVKELLEKIENLRSMYPMLDEYNVNLVLDCNASECLDEEGNRKNLRDYTIQSDATRLPLDVKVVGQHKVEITNEFIYK